MQRRLIDEDTRIASEGTNNMDSFHEDKVSTNGESDSDDKDLFYEKIIQKIGPLGKFQLIQCALCLTPMFMMTFMALGFVFTGYAPPHHCNHVNETELLEKFDLLNYSDVQFDYRECDIRAFSNQTGQQKEILSVSCPNGRHFPSGKHVSFVSEWDLVCENIGLVEISHLLSSIGNIIGGFIVPVIADRLGRKPVLCVAAVIDLVMEFSLIFAPNLHFIWGAFFMHGITHIGVSSTYLVLALEMLLPQHRDTFGIVTCQYYSLCIPLVGLAAYLLEDTGWRYFQATSVASGLMMLAMPFFLYESPRWLAINGQPNKALGILEKACKQNGKNFLEVKEMFKDYMASIMSSKPSDDDLVSDKEETNNSHEKAAPFLRKQTNLQNVANAKRYTLLNMVTQRDTFQILIVMLYMWTTAYVTYYGIYMSSSNMVGNRFLNFCLMGLMEIPCNSLTLYMMKRMGRLQVTRTFIGLAAFSLLGSLLLDQFYVGSDLLETGSLILFLVGKFAVTCFYNVIYIFTPEIFPTVLRTSGFGLCANLASIGYILAPYSRPLYTIAKWAPGTIFTFMSFSAFLLSFLLTETKDKILPTKLSDIRSNENKILSHIQDEDKKV